MTDEANFQQWLAALDSDDLGIRIDAINQLGKTKAIEAVPKLIELLDDADFNVQMAVIDALGQISDDRAISPLAEIAQGEPGPLQSQAATALFTMQTPDALAAIEHLRDDGDDYALGAAELDLAEVDALFDVSDEDLDEELAEAELETPAAKPGEDRKQSGENEEKSQRGGKIVGKGKSVEQAVDKRFEKEVAKLDDDVDLSPEPQAPPAPAPTAGAVAPLPPDEAPVERARRRVFAEPSEPSPTLTGDVDKSLEQAIKEAQEVQFSAYYPREVQLDDWQPLQAYVFKRLAESRVAEDAVREIGPLDSFRRTVERAWHSIGEGETITATPMLPGFQFNPPMVSMGFYEDWHRLSFKMRAKDAPLNQAANGFLTFTANGIIVADVPLSVFVTNDTTQNQPQASETRPIYNTVFASYSHRDTQIVEQVEAAAKSLGMTYLRDVITLRSGENWGDRLLEMIEQATIFQLFWSAKSAKSPHCRMEWEHAIKLNRAAGNFVRPVYWSQPMPPPPPQLQHVHFAYMPDLVN